MAVEMAKKILTPHWRMHVLVTSQCYWISPPRPCEGDALGWMPRYTRMSG